MRRGLQDLTLSMSVGISEMGSLIPHGKMSQLLILQENVPPVHPSVESWSPYGRQSPHGLQWDPALQILNGPSVCQLEI